MHSSNKGNRTDLRVGSIFIYGREKIVLDKRILAISLKNEDYIMEHLNSILADLISERGFRLIGIESFYIESCDITGEDSEYINFILYVETKSTVEENIAEDYWSVKQEYEVVSIELECKANVGNNGYLTEFTIVTSN